HRIEQRVPLDQSILRRWISIKKLLHRTQDLQVLEDVESLFRGQIRTNHPTCIRGCIPKFMPGVGIARERCVVKKSSFNWVVPVAQVYGIKLSRPNPEGLCSFTHG